MGSKCSSCKKERKPEDFASRGNGKKHKRCKFCQREYNKKHYKENKDKYIKRALAHNAKTRKNNAIKIAKLKSETPCTDCKKKYPYYVMEFDHVRGEKIGNVADLSHTRNWKQVSAEIEKCEIVCANCHRERTWSRKN